MKFEGIGEVVVGLCGPACFGKSDGRSSLDLCSLGVGIILLVSMDRVCEDTGYAQVGARDSSLVEHSKSRQCYHPFSKVRSGKQ